ncbi:MAG: DUF4129 domain-containing protein [Arcicella sp.]|nr:DUF4129 domain-containing protein [Arcicella sp.]
MENISKKTDNCSKIIRSDYRLTLVKTILLYGLILLTTNSISAIPPKQSHQTLAQDSTKITVRKPSESKMTAFKKSKDYQYGIEESQVLDTWWKRLLRRLFNWFGSLFTGAGNPTLWKTVAYVFVASVVVYVMLKLMGINFTGLYRKKNTNEIPYETLGENIHVINFVNSIAEAVDKKNYRLAVRLYYLKSLKELTDREMIDWQINKTNRSYVYELNSPTLRPDFETITRQFEYAWYGDFPVDEDQFITIKNQFLTFSNSVFANG